MAPLIALLVSFLFFRVLGLLGWAHMDDWYPSLQGAVAVMFLLTATAHWGKKRVDLIRMIPSALPRADWIVSITGGLEVAGAIGILFPSTSRITSIGLTLLLLAMFPANVKAARERLTIGGKPTPTLFIRTLLQIIFIAAVLWAG